MNKECTKIMAVRMAFGGFFRGIVECPVCEFGHSPYDVVKQPQKYKEEIEKLKQEGVLVNF